MLQINLLPDIKKEFLHAQRQRNFVISICIVVSIVAAGATVLVGLVLGGQAIQKAILTQSIKDGQNEISKLQSSDQLNEYLTIQNQLRQIGSLKSDQKVYSRVMDYLKQLNPAAPNNVSLDLVEVTSPVNTTTSTSSSSTSTTPGTSNAGKITVKLSGNTANYKTLNVFKTTLEQTNISYSDGSGSDVKTEKLFSSVVNDSSSLSQTKGVDFVMTVTCNDAAFKYSSADIKLTIPSETTSDSDRNAPKNVFNSSDKTSTGSNDGTNRRPQ